MHQTFTNPILSGFHPDPSICRKGNDFYLVTSTFEYFPGVPVFHSRDLVHWEQIGHCLNRPEQLNLHGLNCSKGIYAPTIHYQPKQDLFYMITTLVDNGPYLENINFFVTAKDPAGPWSDPVVVQGAEGIDPSLFWDEDGKAYYVGNLRPDPLAPPNGKRHIWMQEVNLETGELLGEKHILRTAGALENARCPEGPHIYRINGWYYLLTAEGGTEINHSVTIFRSRQLFGPYESNPRNPILTHRHLQKNHPIGCTGHADLFQTQTGEWWAVLLGTRPMGEIVRGTMGRETFLVPVNWEDEWPVFCPDAGRVELTCSAPNLPEHHFAETPACDQFESRQLSLCWAMPRTPEGRVYSLDERPGWLRLFLKPDALRDAANPAFIGRRQQHMHFAARSKMCFQPENESECAGMALLMSSNFYLSMEYAVADGQKVVRLVRRCAGKEEVLASVPCHAETLWLKICVHELCCSFYFAQTPEEWQTLTENVDGSLLSPDRAGGFTGTFIGMYASANGTASNAHADFDWFEYQPLQS